MKIKDTKTNDLVAYSRAGDVFHYRWAARRCLKLIQPNSNLQTVIIEGSDENNKSGEYVIDVSEYYSSASTTQRIEYYQLKHSTVQNDKPLTLSNLKGTIEGFSKRYTQHFDGNTLIGVSFSVITNRKIADSFKKNLWKISQGIEVSKQFNQTIKEYTNLTGKHLIEFCKMVKLEDGEGDYNLQKENLRVEMARLQPGTIDAGQLDSIVSIVQDRVLPHSTGKIIKQDILRPFGVTSEMELFPAPPEFENIDKITIREIYKDLIDEIHKSNQPVIIQAEGGVGKSVFSQYILQILPEGSVGITYDCFGSGKYRSRSGARHRHRDALVQIINELAMLGFCDPMLVQNTTQEDMIMRGFLNRIALTLKSLKKIKSTANLFILVDAADNAEMAAQEYGDSCFAKELLREEFPRDCHIIMLCRPERIQLLKPPSHIPQLSLLPFSKEETYMNLKQWFPAAIEDEGSEFHRLTNGNPRVQMNSIAAGHSSVKELLSYLGPYGTTVEKQIELQLETAVQQVRKIATIDYQDQVDKICLGLASLPPNIPIEVLAKASEVKKEDVRSFVADIGRSLWLLDSSVQFRDEPTETWFRMTYLATEDHFAGYIKVLEPLAAELTYVAEVLPQLYLQAGMYDQLIEMALSEQLLPQHNPIDKRNVLVYRLQFAFKAALRSQKYEDAIRIALRAGEEVAGDHRQQNLFKSNTDILPLLQSNSKIQEIAFKRRIRSVWEGSENVYSASLLSGIEEYKGEASGYLRSSMDWLMIYFEQLKKSEHHNRDDKVSDEDLITIAQTHLRLFGARNCLRFLNRFKPKEAMFRIIKGLVNQLIDAGRFQEIEEILKYAKRSKFHVVAIVSELVKIGRFPESEDLEHCLNTLINSKKRIKKPNESDHDILTPSIVAFLEACLHCGLNYDKILKGLNYYVPNQASSRVGNTYNSKDRVVFLKALAIRNIISKEPSVDLDDLVPKLYKENDKKRRFTDEIINFKELVSRLIPWYELRASLIKGESDRLLQRAKKANIKSQKSLQGRYRPGDPLPKEISKISSEILVYCKELRPNAVKLFYEKYIKDNSTLNIDYCIDLLRAGHRSSHLNSILLDLEASADLRIKGLKNVDPEEIANYYVSLTRAIISKASDDAAVYFDEAINIVSKFGDELIERWEAVVSLGEQAGRSSKDELAYRFIRCAEMVGEYVSREKHWDRSGAIVTSAGMSPQIAISALSRWRDRNVGRFDYQLESLIIYLVNSETIDAAVGWSMTRLLSDHSSKNLFRSCLAKESNKQRKQQIFDDEFNQLKMEGIDSNYWSQLKEIGEECTLSSEELNSIVQTFNVKYKLETSPNSDSNQENKGEEKNIKLKSWDSIFNEVEILEPEGLKIIHQRSMNESKEKEDNYFFSGTELYLQGFKRLEPSMIHYYIDLLLNFDKINIYEFEQFLQSLPSDVTNKASFKKKWPSVVYRFGCKYAHDLVSCYKFNSTVKNLSLENKLIEECKKGIFHGMSQGQEFADASLLFGFVKHASTLIDSNIACDLADYAIVRFELHMDEGFGDGQWDKWLTVPQDINKNISGLIWSALGSPIAETRWKACHAVKKLADFNCINLLNNLIECFKDNTVNAFGSKQFPFYDFHARQYLLISLCRISVDHPVLLISFKGLFYEQSQLTHHILIKKFSAATALNIEKGFPGTYSTSETSDLQNVGKEKQRIVEEKSKFKADNYKNPIVEKEMDYYFGLDFSNYWLAPLARVFGLSLSYIENLCREVIINEWKLGKDWGYNSDPRVSIWDRSNDRHTYYHKSDYPKIDTRDFYLSYHSMLVVASRLLDSVTIVKSDDNEFEEDWSSWLSRHQLTREDTKWLSDYKISVPVLRPDWIFQKNIDTWRTVIKEHYFLQSIQVDGDYVVVKGGKTERESSRYETYSVSSAFVSKETSEALLMALSTCSDPHDYKLPDYEEDNMEIEFGQFKLKGWISNTYDSKGIDQFDPNAAGIDYPPYSPGDIFKQKLGLFEGTESNNWYLANGELALKCNIWSGNVHGYDEEPQQSGHQLVASLTLIKKLCKAYNCDLIIDVKISRDIEYKYRAEVDNKYEYKTHNKLYLFTADGGFRSI